MMNPTSSSLILVSDPSAIVPVEIFLVMLIMSIGGIIFALLFIDRGIIPSIISILGSTLMLGSIPSVARIEPILLTNQTYNQTTHHIVVTAIPALSVWWWWAAILLIFVGILILIWSILTLPLVIKRRGP